MAGTTSSIGNLNNIYYVTFSQWQIISAEINKSTAENNACTISAAKLGLTGNDIVVSKLDDFRIKEELATSSEQINATNTNPAQADAIYNFIKGYTYTKEETSSIINNFLATNTICAEADIVKPENASKYVTAGAISAAIANATGEKYQFIVSNQEIQFNPTVHDKKTVNSFCSIDGRLTFSAGTDNKIEVGVVYPPITKLV